MLVRIIGGGGRHVLGVRRRDCGGGGLCSKRGR